MARGDRRPCEPRLRERRGACGGAVRLVESPPAGARSDVRGRPLRAKRLVTRPVARDTRRDAGRVRPRGGLWPRQQLPGAPGGDGTERTSRRPRREPGHDPGGPEAGPRSELADRRGRPRRRSTAADHARPFQQWPWRVLNPLVVPISEFATNWVPQVDLVAVLRDEFENVTVSSFNAGSIFVACALTSDPETSETV